MNFDRPIPRIPWLDLVNLQPVILRRIPRPADIDVDQNTPSFRTIGYQRFSGRNVEGFIAPHNFPTVYHLNLSETWYSRYSGYDDPVLPPRQGNFPSDIFLELYVNRRTYKKLLRLLNECPDNSRNIKVFLTHIRLSNVIKDINTAVVVFEKLLHFLYRYHNDSALVLNLLQTFSAIVPVQHLLLTSGINLECIRYILRHANKARFDLHQFLAENIGMNPVRVLPFCPVLESLLNGTTSLLEVFISHGFVREEYNMGIRNFIYPRYLGYLEEIRIQLPPRGVYNLHVRRQFLILETFYTLYKFVFREIRDRTTNWILSGQLIFRSIPDPLISRTELTNMLIASEASQGLLATIRAAYETNFSEIIVENFEPRSLLHLSRCVIRTALKDNFQLPNGIRRLNLSNKLSSYLRLHS